MPEDMPDRMPEDMTDRMPEDMPVRKCIHVMVGITRSKVIFTATMWIRAPCSYTATSMVAKWNSFNGRACLYMVISY